MMALGWNYSKRRMKMSSGKVEEGANASTESLSTQWNSCVPNKRCRDIPIEQTPVLSTMFTNPANQHWNSE